MTSDITTLYKRFTALEAEITINQRKRKEEAIKAVEALSQISESDIELLKEYIPDLPEVVKFSVDDLMSNNNNEVVRLQRVYTDLSTMLDKWLKRYEEGLC